MMDLQLTESFIGLLLRMLEGLMYGLDIRQVAIGQKKGTHSSFYTRKANVLLQFLTWDALKFTRM